MLHVPASSPTSPSAHVATPSHDCPNCGSALPTLSPPPLYCAHCGQETALHPPSVREFVHEFIGHYVALEGALWKTLALLVLQPGRLTREYLAGRRRRYVLPLRLYLSASFLFFVAVKLLPGLHNDLHVQPPSVQAQAPAAAYPQGRTEVRGPQGAIEFGPLDQKGQRDVVVHLRDCLQPGARCPAWKRALAPTAAHWHAHPKEATEHFRHLLVSLAPYAVFLMLPVFAAFTMLAYRRRHMLYGEHLVFSLHMHSFWFLALLLLAVLPDSVSGWGQLAMMVYAVVALRRVYGGRWPPTLLRAALIGVVYSAALVAGTIVLLAGAIVLA